jgi:hypothetical protein
VIFFKRELYRDLNITFYRLNANLSFEREPYRVTFTVFRYFSIKILILIEFIRKARTDAFLYEKAIITDIYAVRFALISVFSFKK